MIPRLLLITVILLLISYRSFPQSDYSREFLDSIFVEYVNLKEAINNKNNKNHVQIHTEKSKCGFSLVNFVKQNINLFTERQQEILKSLSGRPDTTRSIISPSGKFRIHYYLNNDLKPKYISTISVEENLSLIAAVVDSVYNFEVSYLGYSMPPIDNGAGGDNLYDVYVSNLGDVYGYTEWENVLANQKYTSFMVIDNDYNGFYSSGIEGLKVTVAHEFHHAIQMGNYILRLEDQFFYEITSTSMEDFVYDDVNDYYAYLPHYFNNPGKPFSQFNPSSVDGYDLAIWNIYLKEKFGFNIIKRQWELMVSQRAMNAINTSITEAGSSFKHELNEFGLWTYHTKHRAISNKYFDEASFYPLVKPLSSIRFTSPDDVVTIQSKPTANNFIQFSNSFNNDTLFILITNGDVQAAINNISHTDSFAYYLYNYPASGASQIDSIFYSKFTTSTPSLWTITEILDTMVSVHELQLKTNYPYPMPFSYKIHLAGKINIPVSAENVNTVGLYIFSTGMELIYSNDAEEINTQNKNVILWSVKDNHGEKLASGVYLYVIKSGNNIEKGKLVILHD